jgi:hypothetical protein
LKCIAKDDFLRKCQAENIHVNVPTVEADDTGHAPASGAQRPAGHAPAARPAGNPAEGAPRGPLPQRGAPAAAPQRAPAPANAPSNAGAPGASFFDKFKKP